MTTPHRQALLFTALAGALAWVVVSPLWVTGLGLAMPGTPVLLVVMMLAPTVAALITERILPSGEKFARVVTLRPTTRFGHWARYGVVAWLGPIVASAAAVALSVAVGALVLDLDGFSGFAEQLEALGASGLPPIGMLVAIQLASMVVTPFINVIPALGEEIGWRGYLQPRLASLGPWGATIGTGVVWGLWHAPVILLGYNYPGYPPVLALGMMVVFCVLVSILLGWLQTASGTVWVPAVAHGFINGTAALPALLVAAGHPIDSGIVGLLGVCGWAVLLVLVGGLAVSRAFPVRRAGLSS